LDQDAVAFLPLFPDAFAPGVQVPEDEKTHNFSLEMADDAVAVGALPAVFHVGRFIHAAGDFDPQVLVGSVFRYFHLVPFGDLLAGRVKAETIQ
jgi:hypothetical protein